MKQEVKGAPPEVSRHALDLRNPDPIPAWIAWWRKLITIRAVSKTISAASLSPQEFLTRMVAVQSRAVRSADMGIKTAAFWEMENLAAAFLKRTQPGRSLNDARLPVEIRPIAHCGMGIAAVEVAHFDPVKLAAIIESFSSPDYRLFAYEGAGAMLALYEADLFSIAARGFSRLGLIPLAPLRRPPPREFVASFTPEIRRLMAHGYGRMLYFKNSGIGAAIWSAVPVRWLDLSACVQGIAFAYAMVNNADLERVLQAAGGLPGREIRHSFENGLIYALEFWEWMAPGFLETLPQQASAGAAVLVEAARRDVVAARARGALKAFVVGAG
ncbi:MAG: hypothetical protein HY315_10965 [Acidobacteria bacterium]|nr:hypothetical protein [Acidobacteriota bacterium]